MSGDYRLVSVDLPGHGLTRTAPGYPPTMAAFADFVNEFAGAIGLPKFTIAGNSMGGTTAWLVALRHPGRVDALVLVDASGWPEDNQESDPPIVFKLLQSASRRCWRLSILSP